jgi:hypothetical protein
MATVLSIVTDAMVEIGAYTPGDTLASAHQQLGLLRFQNQLDTWQADELTLNLQSRVQYTLTAGTNTVTVGPTGTIATTRPVFIEAINYEVPGTSPITEVPMAPLDRDSYLSLSQKALSSSLPQMFFYNPTTTNGTLFVWPTVSQNVVLDLYLPQGIGVPTALTSSVTGPQGYAEAFMYQLALRLCGPMARPVPDGLPELAAAAFMRMARPNVQPAVMGVDPALTPTYQGAFNVLTGTTSGPMSNH